MRLIGVMALKSFPLWQQSFEQLLRLCDKVYIRFDTVNGDPQILKSAVGLAQIDDKLGDVLMADAWQVPEWREQMLRMLDKDGAADCDIVLCPDEDEMFCDGIEDELAAFRWSDKSGMMFAYEPLKTKDGRVVNGGVPYPPERHMKVFKWKKGLSYYPYHGAAVVSQYCGKSDWWMAKTKIEHYCCWTEAMEKAKHWRSNTPNSKGEKTVTFMGFGPTAYQQIDSVGEIWSVNNCYDVFGENVVKYVTRIFEMHKFGPREGRIWDENAGYLGIEKMVDRNQMKGRTGRNHVDVLNEMGERRRIIMQEPHARIRNSETYPIESIVRQTGVDWFHGTPCYMAAMAIVEGYTRIDCYGVDQMDWEHSIQRECFAGWMMFAIGRGIKVGGCQTWLDRYKKYGGIKRYGYDYAPEWNEWCDKILWQGFPIQVRFKGKEAESRIIHGDMYKPGGK